MIDLAGLLPFFKLVIAFVVMLAGMRFRLGLALSIFCGALVLGPLFGISPWLWVESALRGLLQDKAWLLAGIITTMLLLSDMLEESGQGTRLMETLSGFLRRPAPSLVFFPALIGLLPMPGGAVFSAPLLRTVIDRLTFDRRLGAGLSQVDMAVINYWFRHVWELCWPLYPGLILAATLSGIPLLHLVSYGLPGTVLCGSLGLILLLRPILRAVKDTDSTGTPCADNPATQPRTNYWQVLREGTPVLLAITGALGLEATIAALAPGMHYEIGIITAMLLALGSCVVQNRIPFARVLKMLTRGRLWSMVAVTFSIFIFKEVLLQTGAIAQLGSLAGAGASLFIAAVLLPCLMGVISGITIGFVGPTFPLLLGLLEQLGREQQTLAYVMLALFSGYSGVLASPLHLCFILSCRYFRADMAAAWRRLIVPSLIIFSAGLAYFSLLL